MDLEAVRSWLEEGGQIASVVDGLPSRLLEPLVMSELKIDQIEPGRVLCSMKIPTRLLNSDNSLHGGVTAALVDLVGTAAFQSLGAPHIGVSVEINVSYLDAAYADEEIEIESRNLRLGKNVGVASVEFRKKKTGKLFAQGRHTKYFAIGSKM